MSGAFGSGEYCEAALDDLEQRLISTPEGSGAVRRYFDQVLVLCQLDRGKSFFEKLLDLYPNHYQIRTLYISLCLQLKDNSAAISGIESLVTFSTPDDALLDAAVKVREKVGPKRIEDRLHDQQTLSICMITRNEQRYLPSCLNAVKSIADEIVVVDTGSKDRTADIARIFGARVFDFHWVDDFAAARNVGLEMAIGDWVLILDADEMIAQQDFDALKNMLSKHGQRRTAFIMETRNYTHQANTLKWHANDRQYAIYEAGIGWFPSKKIRLFPNIPSIRFQFPVHELVDPSVKNAGLAVKECHIPIHHYGHLNEARNKRKAEAYFKIGYAKLDQLGDNVAALRELAVQAGQLSLWSESLDLWKRLLKLRPDFVDAYVNMSGACWQMGEYGPALGFARKAMELGGGSKEATYNMAVSLLLLGNAEKAYSVLSVLNRHQPDYLAARFMMAAASACIGNIKESISMLEEIERTSIGKAVIFGIQDLIRRVHSIGLAAYAKNLRHLSGLITAKEGV